MKPFASQVCKIFPEYTYNQLLKNGRKHLAFHCGWKGRGRHIFCDTGGYEERIKCKSRGEVKPSRHFFSYIWKQHTWRAITPGREPGFLVVMLLLVHNMTQPTDMKESPSNKCREDTGHWRASIAVASLITVWYTKEKKWKAWRETTGKWRAALLAWGQLLGLGVDREVPLDPHLYFFIYIYMYMWMLFKKFGIHTTGFASTVWPEF